MRTLVILRTNAQGSAPADLLAGLSLWMIDPRAFRNAYGSIALSCAGDLKIDPYHAMRGERMMLDCLRGRFANGEMTVLMSCDLRPGLEDDVTAAAVRHGYDVRVFACPGAVCGSGAGHGHRAKSAPKTANAVLDAIEPQIVDLSHLDHLVFVGDIHGCRKTMKALIGDHAERNDVGFVFLGDYINKGPRSSRVLRALARDFAGADNAIILKGNHEDLLETWALGGQIGKQAMFETTLPEFEARKYTASEALSLLAVMRDAVKIHWRGLDVLATHGGFGTVPDRLAILSSRQLHSGAQVSDGSDDIDAAWEVNMLGGLAPKPEQTIQVHGHRNKRRKPADAHEGSFNLEGRVETGGHLRALTISEVRCANGNAGIRLQVLEIPNCESVPSKKIADASTMIAETSSAFAA